MKKMISCVVSAILIVTSAGCVSHGVKETGLRPIPRTKAEVSPRGDKGKRNSNAKNTAKKRQAPRIKPDLANIAYGDENPEVQALDVYLAKSETPTPVMVYIHGGGWRNGSKNRIPDLLAKECLPNGISVISVEYRFSYEAIHPAQVNDCTRAIQFIRTKADEWNLNPCKIGVMGGSAGGHLVLWIGLHDDAAAWLTLDSVKRESSRVSCVVNYFGPTDFHLTKEIEHRHPAFRTLLGYDPRTPAEEIPYETFEHVSPISYVSSDDPPVLTVHGTADPIVPVRHATDLDKKLREAGVVSKLVLVEGKGHGGFGKGSEADTETAKFIKENLLKEDDSR
ncbi:alpha/beta hydrolase fold domain-containing protein [Candidatus Hydrogenedentota bacterium]